MTNGKVLVKRLGEDRYEVTDEEGISVRDFKSAANRKYADIEKKALEDCERQDAPIAIITGGQSGSGKGNLTKEAQARFEHEGKCVLIDADDLRESHPDFVHHMKTNDKTAAIGTTADILIANQQGYYGNSRN
jgi:pantothenate kinase-related protein Tda10